MSIHLTVPNSQESAEQSSHQKPGLPKEFLWAFLEGTLTTPNYKNLTWEKEAEENSEESLEGEGEALEDAAEENPENRMGESSSE